MDFQEFATQEVIELSEELVKFLKIYNNEKLKGFTGPQKIVINNSAFIYLFSIMQITNIETGMISIDKFTKTMNVISKYVKRNTKK